jgi:hypothetical protein
MPSIDSSTFLGVHLGGMRGSVAATSVAGQIPTNLENGATVPPAIVFPSLEHGALRYSERGPIPLTGSGLGWPADARGEMVRGGAGRIPIGILWERLQSKDPDIKWDGHQFDAAKGLALALQAKEKLNGRESQFESGNGEDSRTCLVIPNGLTEARQQAILDNCNRLSGQSPILLWRPIAAAFSWLNNHRQALLRRVDKETCLGRLLTIHLGVDGFEACWLELILQPEYPDWILPARGRMDSMLSQPDAGLRLLEDTARACGDSNHGLFGGDIERDLWSNPGVFGADLERDLWRSIWASPGALVGLSGSSPSTPLELWGVDPSFPKRLRAELSNSLLSWIGAELGGPRPNKELSSWLYRVRSSGDQATVLGAVVTGDFGSLSDERGALAKRIVSFIAPEAVNQLVIAEDGATDGSGLASAAAVYVARRAAGNPTYLDTLPRMETMVIERGLPKWKALIPDLDQYVPGGRPWEDKVEIAGLGVPPNSKSLDLHVWSETEDLVKEVSADFATPPTQKVGVHFGLKVEPARGNAEVEVVPEKEGALGRRRVELNWRSARTSLKNREELLAEAAVPCPSIQPRGAWRGLWWNAPRNWQTSIKSLRKCLVQTPQALDGAAVQGGLVSYGVTGSDGKLHELHQADQPELNRVLVAFLDRELERQIVPYGEPYDERKDIYVCLGRSSIRAPRIWDLAQRILEVNGRLSKEESEFLGGCLRDPAQIARFATRVMQGLRSEGGVAGNNYPLKGLWYALQYREDATEQMDSDAAEEVIKACVQRLKGAIKDRRFKFLERHALVVVAFIMRRRIYDDAFFESDSPLARDAKDTIGQMLAAIRSGQIYPMGGTVDPRVLLQRVIDFIDRVGSLKPLTA